MIVDYAKSVGELHRKRFGQFFTHPTVARFMVRWLLDSKSDGIFDPGFGLGAFYDQIPENRRDSFRAMESDSAILDFWKRSSGNGGRFITQGDYLHTWDLKHKNIVCNPPYARFQKFLGRNAVFEEFKDRLGLALSGYTNTASAFLVKSLSELERDGRLAFIMPLEFLNTGYGVCVKKKLLEGNHLFGVIRLECEKEIFPDATTSIGMILYDRSRTFSSVNFYSFAELRSVERFDCADPVSQVEYRQIDPERKWLPFFRKKRLEVNESVTTALKFYGKFSRGIATGANRFFTLNRDAIQASGLDEAKECVPCVTKSSQIGGPFFESRDLALLIDKNQPVFLFSVEENHSPEADSYIKEGESEGYHRRFLTGKRNPWYKTEKREPAPLLLGVFSRNGYKIVRNTSEALHLTCYHGFHPNLFGSRYLDCLFLWLSSNAGRSLVSLASRKYGDGLDKFEPNDLNEAKVPHPRFFDDLPREQIQSALSELKETRAVARWLEKKFEVARV